MVVGEHTSPHRSGRRVLFQRYRAVRGSPSPHPDCGYWGRHGGAHISEHRSRNAALALHQSRRERGFQSRPGSAVPQDSALPVLEQDRDLWCSNCARMAVQIWGPSTAGDEGQDCTAGQASDPPADSDLAVL